MKYSVKGRRKDMTAPAARLARFASALKQAVHDVGHEHGPGIRVTHFWDADSLHFPVAGFRGYHENTSLQRHQFIQALLSAGYIQPVSLLPTHRVELFAHIQGLERTDRGTQTSYSAQLDAFLTEHSHELRSLAAFEETYRNRRDVGIDEAVALLQDLDRHQFTLVEATVSPWEERAARLFKRGYVTQPSAARLPTMSHVLRDPRFDMFIRGLRRHGNENRRPMSDAIDAAALTTLAILNERAPARDRGLYPRFHTSSATLRTLYREETWVRENFAFRLNPNEPEPTGTIWRGTYYYRLRTFFPSLRFSGVALNGGPALAELEALLEDLGEAPSGDSVALGALERHQFSDGSTVEECIRQIESSGMARLWLNYGRHDFARTLIEGMNAIRELGSVEATQEKVDAIQLDYSSYLATGASEVLFGLEVLSHIAVALKHFTVSAVSLGVIRWGVDIETLREWAAPSRSLGAEAFVLQMLDIDWRNAGVDTMEPVCALLLGIDEFELVERLIGSMTPRGSIHPLGLRLMKLAAKLRVERYFSPTQLADIFDEAKGLWEEASDSDRGKLSLAFGYIALHCWRQGDGSVGPLGIVHDSEGWARWSSKVVRDELHRYSGPMLDYAMNHIVYIETLANVGRYDLPALASALEDVAVQSKEYRFLDTVAYRKYLLAARDRRLDTDFESWSRLYARPLVDSLALLGAANRLAESDREVLQHLIEVEQFIALTGIGVA